MITNGQSNIPIIGQAFEVVGCLLQIVIRCKCQPAGHEEVLLAIGLPGQMRVGCPSCHKVYMLASVNKDLNQFQWAIGAPRQEAEKATEASSAS